MHTEYPSSHRVTLKPQQTLSVFVSDEEYEVLTRLANQHQLSAEEFMRRKSLGLRLPQPLSAIMSRIAQSLERIERQLTQPHPMVAVSEWRSQQTLERQVRQLMALADKLKKSANFSV